MAALRTVLDPELHKDLVSLGMIKGVTLDGGSVLVNVELTTPACPLRSQIQGDVTRAVQAVPGVTSVKVEFGAQVRQPGQQAVPGVKNIIVVGSGKGGVGKSTGAANLAVALAQSGASVGLLDADVYGPSIAHMMGAGDERMFANEERKMLPIERHGLRFISMANLMPAGQAAVWRGPMLHSFVQQTLRDAAWGELDYLVVDLPPGTGDVQLSLTQTANLTGAVIVTTPQDVALIDAMRAIDMFKKARVPLLGIIENMSYFIAPDTGNRYDIFGHGGGRQAAQDLNVPFLGEVPIGLSLREDSDAGTPALVAHPEAPASAALREAAQNLAGRVSVQALELLPMA
ncbi:MAG TPA: Mrp/NBP35 family ATP-binding protein [Deinococcales bacterium]|nr:Mrp/NBP35 family ATP-binding protein [Deinococcales bacterium]